MGGDGVCEPGSLADLVAEAGGALPAEQVIAVVEEVFAALEYLHGLGIWHRDLKPSNILVRSLEPLDLVLADFGMSRASEGSYALRSRVVSLGYSPPERATSAAGDWWSLGMIVAELALGRNVFQLEGGEWVEEAVFDEWLRTRRPFDFSGVTDLPLRRLCQGLTRWDRANRWGAEHVRAWLDGENPPVAVEQAVAEARVSVTPFPFTDPHTGRARSFTDPAELAAAMALAWEPACAVLSGAAAHRADQRALRSFLRSLGLSEAEQVLAEQGDVEERLTRLLVLLDPAIAPTFRGFSIDREGLLSLARATGERARAALDAIFTERVLLNYARIAGRPDLAELDANWHDEWRRYEQLIEQATERRGRQLSVAGSDHEPTTAQARGLLLELLLDPGARRRGRTAASEAAADREARRQSWFAQLVAAADLDSAGEGLAVVTLRPLSRRLARESQVEAALDAVPSLPEPRLPERESSGRPSLARFAWLTFGCWIVVFVLLYHNTRGPHDAAQHFLVAFLIALPLPRACARRLTCPGLGSTERPWPSIKGPCAAT